MNPGKEICRELKELRKQIAEENGIPLEIEECKFKGKCDGTCPRCDAEVRYLESALADRIRMGKVAVVAGLALGLSATTALSAESGTVAFSGVQPVVKELVLPTDSVRITGRVVDSLTGKGIEFANIRIFNDVSWLHIPMPILMAVLRCMYLKANMTLNSLFLVFAR